LAEYGPFSVDVARVEGLGGASFGPFIGRLLATEVAASDMAGTTLEITYRENAHDGGVDAGLRQATGTAWVPAGDSAWQFKAGDLGPAGCNSELRGATRAIEILKAGGSYRLVLGKSLAEPQISRRRASLVSAATDMGIADAASHIEVITADGLARWIETYPALAVSPLLGGVGRGALSFQEWSESHPHNTRWISSTTRDLEISGLRASIESGGSAASRIEGVSGLGKSRLALEALRGQHYESLVIYAPAADQFSIAVLIQMRSQGRVGVVVVDECDRKDHEVFASALAAIDSSIHLVTIGEPGTGSTRSPILALTHMSEEGMHNLLRENRPSLSAEAERVVIQVASGNIDYALKLAQAVTDAGPGSAVKLVTEDDIRTFFADQLPEGQLFLGSCALALFSRFGFDGAPGLEIDSIAGRLNLEVQHLRGAAAELERRGLLSKHGRYRTIGPHPVAIYLASKAWEVFGDQIVTQLLPGLEPELTERLFRRAADLGELVAVKPAIANVFADGGPFASLAAIGDGNNATLLTHFAVLAPGTVCVKLAGLIQSASEESLRDAQAVRRDLVWTLEKLAWHSQTFVTAADALLKLALAETEGYANNASGTWVEFFGTMLPGTAATPEARIQYLTSHSATPDPRVRILIVRAAERALQVHESIMVSGELQGGVVVEPRGTPATLGEVWAYRNSVIDILAKIAEDHEASVAEAASKALVGSLHGLLEADANRQHLGEVIARSTPAVIASARVQVQWLHSLFERVSTDDRRPSGLRAFESLLPNEAPAERLHVLAHTRSWDREADDLASELAKTARQVSADNPMAALIDLLSSESESPAAYAIGRAIQLLGVDFSVAVPELAPFANSAQGEALIGFLHGLQNHGDADALDRFLDSADLPALVALRYSTRGTRTVAAMARVDRLVHDVSVADSARSLFAWLHDADQAVSANYLRDWASRIQTQADYNAAVDFAAMQVYQKPDRLPELDAVIQDLVPRLREFPDVGQGRWDWTVLVRRQLHDAPLAVVDLIADMVEADALSAFSGSEESQLLQEAVALGGEDAWVDLMDRLGRGEWRLSFSAREWLGDAVDVAVAKRWVGTSVERARTLANVTNPGGTSLSPTVRYLIDEFGGDEKVPSYLYGQFVSGMWSGNESVRIGLQIEEVQAWLAEPGQSRAVAQWGQELIAHLEAGQQRAIQDEAERDW
jgi:hypothetical protein